LLQDLIKHLEFRHGDITQRIVGPWCAAVGDCIEPDYTLPILGGPGNASRHQHLPAYSTGAMSPSPLGGRP